ncbi:MAG: rod shape-determining protein MreB [Clostridia bacterium]|nr:rod shape-determining protein MreB [Clostridia bacterium]
MPGSDIGIDLGTATILITIRGKGIVLNEPTVVAVDKGTNHILAIGTEAQKMLGRTPGNIEAVRPLRDGVISNYDLTEQLVRYFIKKVGAHLLFKPIIMICVPSLITEVEERAVVDAAMQAGARRVYLIEEPKAAAIGAGIDITSPYGHMVVDIGGGTTDIAVITLNDIAVSTSVKVAGDKFNEAVIRHFRKRHSILIGERTAEEIKIRIGCVTPREQTISMPVKGRCLLTGLPKMLEITSDEIMEALVEPAGIIYEAIHWVLERTPPELVGDISTGGIVMTGGGSLLCGLDRYISKRTGIKAIVADDPVTCVAKGTGKALESHGQLQDGLLYISRNKKMHQ